MRQEISGGLRTGNFMAIRLEQGNHRKVISGSTFDDPPEMQSIARIGDGTRRVRERGTKRHAYMEIGEWVSAQEKEEGQTEREREDLLYFESSPP